MKYRILVVSGCSNEQRSFGDLSAKNNSKYCKKFGYDFKYYTGDKFYFTFGIGIDSLEQQTEKRKNIGRAPNWNKVSIVASNIEKYDYVLWVDADAFIMNFEERIEDVFGIRKYNNKHFFLSPDAESLNVGVFLIKNTPEMRLLLREWCNLGFRKNEYYTVGFVSKKKICFYEQAAFSQLYYSNWNNLMALTEILSADRINAHLQNEYWRVPFFDYLQFKEGRSFILHLAGIPNKVRTRIAEEIVRGEFNAENYSL